MRSCVPLLRQPHVALPPMRSLVSFPNPWGTLLVVFGFLRFQSFSPAGGSPGALLQASVRVSAQKVASMAFSGFISIAFWLRLHSPLLFNCSFPI